MSGTTIRVIDLPDLGTITDAASVVADKSGTGRFSMLAIKNYCAVATLPEAPSNNTPYGRRNGAWTPVLAEAPSNGTSFARLNATWSPVPPEAPLSGAVYGRCNAGWTPVLPLSGGGLDGGLGVNGTLNVAGGTYTDTMNIGASVGFEWAFGVQGGSQNHVMVHRGNYYDVWLPATGAREWISPAGVQMTLDSDGSLSVRTNLSGAAVWVTPNAFGFAPGGQGTKFFHGASYYWEWNQTTGQQTWISNNTPLEHARLGRPVFQLGGGGGRQWPVSQHIGSAPENQHHANHQGPRRGSAVAARLIRSRLPRSARRRARGNWLHRPGRATDRSGGGVGGRYHANARRHAVNGVV